MGCFPLFVCRDWAQLAADLEEIDDDLVCLSLVTDPFGEFQIDDLQRWFPDGLIPFKEHFVTDLSRPMQSYVHPHHTRDAKRGLKTLHIEVCKEPAVTLDRWVELFGFLTRRHAIRGISAYSRSSFQKQLAVPGMIALQALHQAEVIGMALWFIQGEVAYNHLAAYNELGYKLSTSYALYWSAIQYFSAIGLKWLCLGGTAGLAKRSNDGLTFFKRGWSTGTRTAYFCGRIFNRPRYREITAASHARPSNYFPAYRVGEFS